MPFMNSPNDLVVKSKRDSYPSNHEAAYNFQGLLPNIYDSHADGAAYGRS